jgi:ADP-ribose pyrophosphatase YjhB (NUDIX family)
MSVAGTYPAVHVEAGESPAAAIARETLEEAGASFSWAAQLATVCMPERHDVMLFYATSAFTLSAFSPAHDAFERAVMPLHQFKERYCGPWELLDWLVEAARTRLPR